MDWKGNGTGLGSFLFRLFVLLASCFGRTFQITVNQPWHIDVFWQFNGGLLLLCGGTFVAKAIHGCDGIMAHLLGTGIELPLSIGDTCGKEVFCLGHIDGIGVGTIDVVERPPPILPQGGGAPSVCWSLVYWLGSLLLQAASRMVSPPLWGRMGGGS